MNVNLFPYEGVHTCKIPAKQPSLPLGYFTRNLVAVSLDKQAKHVLWFLFDTTVELNIWVSAIKRTIPRLNPSFYNVELGSVTEHSLTLSRCNSEKKRRLRRSYSNASGSCPLTTTFTTSECTNFGSFPNNPTYDYCPITNAEIIFVGGDGYSGAESGTLGLWSDFSKGGYGTCGSGDNGGYSGSDASCGGGDCGGGGGGGN
uniref:PH domain-containing protein n=1 Tax=Panagrolaimus davidi TaxID=227884 RepID=A0A914P1N7_9BILA